MENQSEENEQDMRSKREKRNRLFLLLCSLLYTPLFVGALSGWGPMQLLLERNGSFSYKCSVEEQAGPSGICPAQTVSLLRIQLVAQVFFIVSPIFGAFVDKFGAKAAFTFMTACCWLGNVFLLVASATTSASTDPLFYVAFSLLSLCTIMGALLTVQIGLYYDANTPARGRVIFALNALFDTGSITYLGLWGIGIAANMSLTAVVGIYGALSLSILGPGLYFWHVAVPEHELEEGTLTQSKESEKELDSKNNKSAISTIDHGNGNECDTGLKKEVDSQRNRDEISASNLMCSEFREHNDYDNTPAATPQLVAQGNDHVDSIVTQTGAAVSALPAKSDPSVAEKYIVIAERKSRDQLVSGPFLLVCVYFSIHAAASQWNMATQRDFLAFLGDDNYNNLYLTIFTILMPVSIVAMPFGDVIVQRFGYIAALHVINLLSITYNVIKLASLNLNVQVVGFAIFSCFRCFLYGICLSFLPTFLASKVVGKAMGCLFFLMGSLGFVSVPLASLAVEKFGGNFFIPN